MAQLSDDPAVVLDVAEFIRAMRHAMDAVEAPAPWDAIDIEFRRNWLLRATNLIDAAIQPHVDRLLAEARAKERAACVSACSNEHLVNYYDPDAPDDDKAYDRGVGNCVAAIRNRSTP